MQEALKTGGAAVGPTRWGKGTKLMAITDAGGLPLSIYQASANAHEVTRRAFHCGCTPGSSQATALNWRQGL